MGLFRPTTRIIYTVLTGAVFLYVASFAEACPTCKEAIHENGSGDAYAVSILLMMSMPFVIIAFWTILILNLRAQARRLFLASEG